MTVALFLSELWYNHEHKPLANGNQMEALAQESSMSARRRTVELGRSPSLER
jgi:hypothetical protein